MKTQRYLNSLWVAVCLTMLLVPASFAQDIVLELDTPLRDPVTPNCSPWH